MTADQTTTCSEEETNLCRGLNDRLPADVASAAFSNTDSLDSAKVNGHANVNAKPDANAHVKTMHITGV